jgi:tetratricopeptide (TPR) repeat protein
MGNEYSTGLTLSTLAAIARLRGNYTQAIEYGEEASKLFRELEDAHGIALASWSIAAAKRRMAKHALEKEWQQEEAYKRLTEAKETLQNALDTVEEAGLSADIMLLQAELGRLHRDLGNIADEFEGPKKGIAYYRSGERLLKQALDMPGWAIVDKANTLQDLAEICFLSDDLTAANECLDEVETLIGNEYKIIPGKSVPNAELAQEYFAPLAKVEMLRGQMAFDQGAYEQGLQHYILAYAYFMRFSPDAIEKDTMVEYLYINLREIERKQDLVQSCCEWASEHDFGIDVNSFIQILEDLLGG